MMVKYNYLVLIFSFLYLCERSTALYEDQIKKLDWIKHHIGKVEHASLSLDNNYIVVATEENVIAALSKNNGEIIWRQVLEKSSRGDIKLFDMQDDSDSLANVNSFDWVADILTISGHAPALVRGWAANTGILQWEWSLMPLNIEAAENSFWIYENFHIYHIIPVWNSHLEVTKYYASSGQGKNTTTKISANWIRKDQCSTLGGYFLCISANQIIALHITHNSDQLIYKSLPNELQNVPQIIQGNILALDDRFLPLGENKINCNLLSESDRIEIKHLDRQILLQQKLQNGRLQIIANYEDDCTEVPELSVDIDYPNYYGNPKLMTAGCKIRYTDKKICSILISASDGGFILIEQGKIKWTREESLASIKFIKFFDLPLSDAEGVIESELKSKPGDIIGSFARRIASQIIQMKNILLTVLGLGNPPTATQKAGLTRDAFGLHKIIVVLTKSGKLFGIDNLTGKQHWVQYIPYITNFNNEQPMQLLIQRTAKHFPHNPICAIVGKDPTTGRGVLYRFNPITGQLFGEGLIRLPYKIKQFALLHTINSEFIKGIILFDEHDIPHVSPENLSELANGMYMYTADKSTSILKGYYIDAKENVLKAIPLWQICLADSANNHKITTIAMKNQMEHVHSQGRVLSDRSVLYKYINPNLVAVVTQGLDSIHKYITNIYLIDVISGSIIFSMSHRKVRGPLHIVHSENWLVYSYYNDKVRRTEITTIELYEGKVQANSTIWSSLDAPPLPLIEKQSYIFPATIEAMRETITEKGITNKHVLIAISNGGIVEIPWALLDPRRPVSMPNEMREEGSIPYIPELPIPTENIINYNQSISRISGIHTAPSGLESTCLVVAHGLDLFVTRVSPSKTFDLLKEDFDYFLITTVLIGLITASFIVQQLSAKKTLKQAWK